MNKPKDLEKLVDNLCDLAIKSEGDTCKVLSSAADAITEQQQIINELCDLLGQARKKVGLVMVDVNEDGSEHKDLRLIIDEAVAKARGESDE